MALSLTCLNPATTSPHSTAKLEILPQKNRTEITVITEREKERSW